MFSAILFFFALGAYAAFLLWCFLPVIRLRMGHWLGWLRVFVGVLLLGANIIPILSWPFLLPVAATYTPGVDRLMAVLFFPRTLPKYLMNIYESWYATATIVDVKYPIEISGIRYEPVVRTACVYRRALSLDKGLAFVSFNKFPTSSGGVLSAYAGHSIVALDHSYNICSHGLRKGLSRGPLPDLGTGSPVVYIVRGEAYNTRVYTLRHSPPNQTVSVDKITLHPLKIVDVTRQPARNVISLDDLWPILQSKDRSLKVPIIIQAFQHLSVGDRACVRFVSLGTDFRSNKLKITRHARPILKDVPVNEHMAHCREVLERKIPLPTNPELVPIAR